MYMDCLHGKWPLDAIKAVFSRRFLLQNCAVEVYTSAGSKFTLCSVVLSLLYRRATDCVFLDSYNVSNLVPSNVFYFFSQPWFKR